ncbi:hypothetical protein EYF80_022436 [Liparis tanakae]|uniref:Uncharacterized protein n=1 Tax=Liparis tanakae TaxID=230148 RepID=A0A4Z2HNC5_9TELE|nr:hypothetical protein EYF80_022436 [Liparis tanakae]
MAISKKRAELAATAPDKQQTGLLKPGALPALSARRQVSVSGGGEGRRDAGAVEGGRGVRVQRGLGEGAAAAAAPRGGRVAVGRAQGGVAARPVQQLEVAEEAGGGEQRSDFIVWKRQD